MCSAPASTASSSIFRNYLQLPAALHILCAGTFLNKAGSFVIVFMTLYVTEHLKLDATFATRCIGAFGVGSILSALIGGQLADRFGRRSTMIFALWGGAVMLALISVVNDGLTFMLCVFVFAVIAEMYRPASAAMIGDLVPPSQRAFAFGLMYIAINLGFAVAPPVGGLLADHSFQLLFWGDAVTTAFYGFVILLFIRETHPGFAQTNSSSHSPDHTTHADIPLRAAVRIILKDRTFMAWCLGNLLTSLVFMQAFSTLPLYMRELGYSKGDYGRMICINGILIVLLQVPMTHFLSRFNRVSLILAGELLLGIGFGLTAFATTTWHFLGTIVIWTLGEIIQAPFKQAIVADMAPRELRARYQGVFTMSHSVAMAVGPPVGGEILSRFGAASVWITTFFVILMAISIYCMIFQRLTALAAQRTG
ncbi:MAG: MFS transporter [Planctomyces sp.]|nr:MFS transporter [Planctomyces sp.]